MSETSILDARVPGQAGRDERLWTPADVVEYLCGEYTEKTLMNWRSRKIGPPYVKVSARGVFYRREAVIAWAARIEQATATVGEVA